MHDLLYERQQEWAQLSGGQVEDRLIEYAEELGLDADRFAQELREHVYRPKVEADTQAAQQGGLPGTPSYIVNGVLYPTNDLGLHPLPIAGFIRLTMVDTYTDPPPTVIDPGEAYVATIRTSKGDIVVELFVDQAPVNVNNFVFLAWDGWYDGQEFFFVEPGVAAYTGDPTSMGWGLPLTGYYCGDEIDPDLAFDQAGMVAFYAPQPGLISSLFFITYDSSPDFDGQHTIIGRVIEGMDVVESITVTTPGLGQPEPDTIETILVEKQ